MQNDVSVLPVLVPVEEQFADRSVDPRRMAYAEEVRRLIDATYSVMRATGDIDPRVGEIVRTAGLSNQAFYRHFKSKDELLLAVLTDGQQRLLGTLTARMARVEVGAPRVAAWIRGVLAQAQNRDAAENTRPFAMNGARLADLFPNEWMQLREAVISPLRVAVADAGGDPTRDAVAIYHLAFGLIEDALKRRTHPTHDDAEHLVKFAMRGAGIA